MNLQQLYEEIKIKYNIDNDIDANIFQSYLMLAELLNPDNSYEYVKMFKGCFKYHDMSGNELFVRLVYQPTNIPYFEVKPWWIDDAGKRIYHEVPQTSNSMDWDKRTNTIAKIYRDELLPIFLNQDLSDILIFKPVDAKRYYFSLRMARKYLPSGCELEENIPTEVRIIKQTK